MPPDPMPSIELSTRESEQMTGNDPPRVGMDLIRTAAAKENGRRVCKKCRDAGIGTLVASHPFWTRRRAKYGGRPFKTEQDCRFDPYI